jgi:hypothetical protein
MCGQTFSLLLLDTLALLLFLNGLASLLLSSPSQAGTVVGLVPLPERRSIDLDDGGLRQSIRADEFVVRRMEDDTDDTGLASDAFGSPREVARVEAQGAELAVAATRADKMDALAADTCVGRLATFLESSVCVMPCQNKARAEAIGLRDMCCIPLLAVVSPLCTGGGPLVARIS